MASALVKAVASSCEQLGARGRGAEGAERRGGVPALLVMMEIDGAGDLGLDLDAGDIGLQHRGASRALMLGQRPQRRHHRRGGMAAQRVAAIVEIERVGGGAVDGGGVERRRPLPTRPNRLARAVSDRAQRPLGDPRARLGGAGQRHPDGVENGEPGDRQAILGHVVEADGNGALGKPFEQHTAL